MISPWDVWNRKVQNGNICANKTVGLALQGLCFLYDKGFCTIRVLVPLQDAVSVPVER
jgi:hypothetical protein